MTKRPRQLPPLVGELDSSLFPRQNQPKVGPEHYQTPEHRAWRRAVLKRAGHRCEAIALDGQRCTSAAPAHRLFADHVVEIADGGDPLDTFNGECLCSSHHLSKTARERRGRQRE
jgi:5-methylcytosine-specific restriction protein A